MENSRKALEVFLKAGLPQGTEATYAASDGKTFINIVESDTPDMVASSTYAPFWDKSEVFPVVAVDETWLQAIQAAQANWQIHRATPPPIMAGSDGIRRPAIATVAAGIIIGGLALAVVVPAHHDAASRASATTRTQQPRAIDVLIASTVSFPLKGTPGALLQVQYLQTGHGPAAIWATLAASGLPQDTSYYTATAGDCAGGRPRILASASSLPDPHTDMLILPLNNLPASVPTEIWIKVTNAGRHRPCAPAGHF